ncbi:MAG: hypothetical protein JNL08_12440 [Planctomycetes bacterium]|nr:hypothetical protein [Planctomycetota bacterium]
MLRSPVLFLFGCALAAQAAPRDPAALLPTSTYAVVRFGGLGACRTAAGELPASALVLGCLARLPAEVRQRHFERGLDEAAATAQDLLQRSGFAPEDVRAVLGRPMALAVGRPTLFGMGPSICLCVDQGSSEAAFARCRAALRDLVAANLPGVAFVEERIDGLDVELLQVPEAPPLYVAAIGGQLVLTNSRGYLGEVAAVAAGQAPSLASRLAEAPDAAAGPLLAGLFVDAGALAASLAPHLPYEADALADALGLGAPSTIAASCRAGLDRLQVGIGGRADGLCKVLLRGPTRLDFAAACSPNTVLFGAGSVDAPGLVRAWRGFAALLPPAARHELQREFGREFGRLFADLGTTPAAAERLTAALGPQVQFALALEKGALPKPELLCHVAVRDADTVAAALQRLEARCAEHGLEWRERPAGDAVIRFCNVRLGGDGPQLSPCYVLRADGLWCASDAAALARALRQGEAPDASLAAQPDFAAVVAAARDCSGVLHLRLFRTAELGWRSLETLAQPALDARRDELGFGAEVLPDGEEAAAALGCCTWSYRIDDRGVTVEARGTLTLGAVLASLGALADAVLARAGARVF